MDLNIYQDLLETSNASANQDIPARVKRVKTQRGQNNGQDLSGVSSASAYQDGVFRVPAPITDRGQNNGEDLSGFSSASAYQDGVFRVPAPITHRGETNGQDLPGLSSASANQDGVFRVPAPITQRGQGRESDGGLSIVSTATTSQDITMIKSLNVESLLTEIDHVESFLNVLNARSEFRLSQARRARHLQQQSGVRDIEVDITQYNIDYNKNIKEHFSNIRQKRLQNLTERKVVNALLLNSNMIENSFIARNAELLKDEYSIILKEQKHSENSLKRKQEAINKQIALMHSINNVPWEELQQKRNGGPSDKAQQLKKKIGKIKSMENMLVGSLCCANKTVASDPKLFKMLQQCETDRSFIFKSK